LLVNSTAKKYLQFELMRRTQVRDHLVNIKRGIGLTVATNSRKRRRRCSGTGTQAKQVRGARHRGHSGAQCWVLIRGSAAA
jgi:hypothetical protein